MLYGQSSAIAEVWPEDYIIRELIGFNDIFYDNCSKLIYGLTSQAIVHFKGYLKTDTERILARELERDTLHWFRPVSGQFNIYYWRSREQPEYIPDFVAATPNVDLQIETKAASLRAIFSSLITQSR